MAKFTLTADKKLAVNDPYLGVQFESNAQTIQVDCPTTIAGLTVESSSVYLVLEGFPIISPTSHSTSGSVISYIFPLTSEYTQKAGTLSVQIVVTSGTGTNETVVRSELAYGSMIRSEDVGDEPSSLYPTVIDEANKAVSDAQQEAEDAASSAEAALTSQNAAKTSETNAKTSETNAKTSETNAASSASAALASQNAAKTSETNAKTSETNAKTSETNAASSASAALLSKNAAATSESNAKTSETNAASSASSASSSKSAAATSETNAKTSETNAASSASAALLSKNAAATSETNAAASASHAQQIETDAESAENTRISNENTRQSNESTRTTNENERVSAESARAFIEDYNANTSYVVGNKAALNGNTYQCKSPCKGITPPNTTYWILISSKGDSGVYVGSGDMPEGYNIQIDPNGGDFSLGALITSGAGYAIDNGSTRPTLGNKAVDESYTTDNTHGATGNYSHAEGNTTIASGNYSHAEGIYSTAQGEASHAGGKSIIASGNYSHAEGIYSTADGEASHAEGKSTAASSDSSHAEGKSTTASGNYSHAEGNYTTASGANSHAEGNSTTASGDNSHAEGVVTTADGEASHAEGGSTTASGYSSHAEGSGTTASGDFSHAEGNTTTASGEAQHVFGKANIIDTTSLEIVGNGTFDEETREVAVRSNARTLDADGNGWFAGKVSAGTVAAPANPTADNDLTTKKYVDTTSGKLLSSGNGYALNNGSTRPTLGNKAVDESYTTDNTLGATGANSHAESLDNTASGSSSHAEGSGNTASGDASHAEGGVNEASAMWAHAEGNGNIASGEASHAEGGGNTADGFAAHSEGSDNISVGDFSHSEGQYSLAANCTLYNITAFNDTAKTITLDSITGLSVGDLLQVLITDRGYSITATSIAAISGLVVTLTTTATINNNWKRAIKLASTQFSTHAEGNSVIANGCNSHAEGSDTIASGYAAHAEGGGNRAFGDSSHAEGDTNIASGANSHVEGKYSSTEALIQLTITSANTTVGSVTLASVSGLSVGSKVRLYIVTDGFPDTQDTTIDSINGSVVKFAYLTKMGVPAWYGNIEDIYFIESDTGASHAHAQNFGTVARGFAQTAIGCNNIPQGTPGSKNPDDYLVIVGNGTPSASYYSPGARSNALTVDWYGNEWLAGTIQPAGGYKASDGTAGANGSFTSSDGKTVTVKNGLIVSIV